MTSTRLSGIKALLASTSVAALLTGVGTPAALAGTCTFDQNGGSAGPISNASPVAVCIDVHNNATVTGDVTNTLPGILTASGAAPPTRTGITIDHSSVAGSIVNAGQIIANQVGIDLNQGLVSNGITNSGTISAAFLGIVLFNGSTFTGGITNSGTISGPVTGVRVAVSTFSGGISNSGTIKNDLNFGIALSNVTQFGSSSAGGITNSGTISAVATGVEVSGHTFFGGINNTVGGTISGAQNGIALQDVSFGGGLTNNGAISSSAGRGIVIVGSVFSGGITNSGSISGANAGIQIGITGPVNTLSTFSGVLTNTGTISGKTGILVTGGSGPVSIFNSGIINGTGATAVDLTGGSAGNTFTLGPGYNISGFVKGNGSDTFQLGGSSGSDTFQLGLIGANQYQGFSTFNVVGATWTVTGTYGQTNPWTVQAGTLNVTGDLSAATSLTVSGGTLTGTGTVGNLQVSSGGVFAPGTAGAPGTSMTVAGNLTFQPGAQYVVFLNPATSSFANVTGTGTASLAGTVDAFFAPGTYAVHSYDILHASGGLGSTTFGGLVTSMGPSLIASLSYTTTDVFLNLSAQLGLGGNLNVNQQNAANAVSNFFNSGGALPPGFTSLFGLSGANLANALTALDGENATGAERSAFQLMNEFLNLMLDSYVDGRLGGSAGGPLGFAPDQADSLPPDIALAYAGVLKAPPKQTFAQRWTAWGSGFGGSARTNGDPIVGSNNVTAGTFGYAAGLDYHYSPDTVLGFALAGGGTSWNLAQGLGTGRSDAFMAGIYGVTHQGPAYLAGELAFANNWVTTNRTALGDQLTASFQGQSYAARLEGGYRYAVPAGASITPYAAIQVQNFQTPSYRETDLTAGGFGLSYNAMNGTDTRSELGARFDDPTLLGHMPLILRARVAWAHDWVSNPALNASFESLPGASFTVNGAPIPHDSALASAGAQLFFTPNWSLLAKFDGEFAKGSQLYAGTGTLRYSW